MSKEFDENRARQTIYSVIFVLKSNMREEDAINMVLDELIKAYPDITRVSLTRRMER